MLARKIVKYCGANLTIARKFCSARRPLLACEETNCLLGEETNCFKLAPWLIASPGLFKNLFMTRRGGGVISQTASQHAYFSAKFCKFPFKISDILQKTKNFDNHLRFAAIPAKFCENRGEKWRIWTKIQQNFAKSREKSRKLIVRRTANLSLERCKGMQIL